MREKKGRLERFKESGCEKEIPGRRRVGMTGREDG